MQPIQESRCIFDGITSNLSIMRRADVALIVSWPLYFLRYGTKNLNNFKNSNYVYQENWKLKMV